MKKRGFEAFKPFFDDPTEIVHSFVDKEVYMDLEVRDEDVGKLVDDNSEEITP